MNCHHASGSEKRKRKKKLEEEANKQRNALLNYVIHTKVENINVKDCAFHICDCAFPVNQVPMNYQTQTSET